MLNGISCKHTFNNFPVTILVLVNLQRVKVGVSLFVISEYYCKISSEYVSYHSLVMNTGSVICTKPSSRYMALFFINVFPIGNPGRCSS